jgi:hypothetical protein
MKHNTRSNKKCYNLRSDPKARVNSEGLRRFRRKSKTPKVNGETATKMIEDDFAGLDDEDFLDFDIDIADSKPKKLVEDVEKDDFFGMDDDVFIDDAFLEVEKKYLANKPLSIVDDSIDDEFSSIDDKAFVELVVKGF